MTNGNYTVSVDIILKLLNDKKVKAAIQGITNEITKQTTEEKKLEAQQKKLAVSTDKATTSNKKHLTSIQKKAKSYTYLSTTLKKYHTMQSMGITFNTKQKRQLDTLRASYERLGGSVKKLNASQGGLLKSFTKARWMLVNITMGIMLAVGAFRLLGKPLMELETEMVTVQKRTKMSDEAIAGLQSNILDLSRTIPGAVTELAKISAVAGQLGIRGSSNITEFTRVTAMMAASTVLNSEEAALAIAKISKAYDLPIAKAENMASVINELSNTTAANSKEISAAVLKMASSTHLLGISMESAAAMSATLIDMGMKAERAGTRMKTVFTRMATESKKIAEVFGGGATAASVGADMAENPERVFNQLLETLSKYESKQEAIAEATRIFGRVGATAVLGLVSNYDALRRNTIAASDEFQKATSLQNEFDIAMSTTTNQWKLYWQNWMANWQEGMTSVNKGFGSWLQKINTGNMLLRTSSNIMEELIKKQKELNGEQDRNLAAEVFDKSWVRASTKGWGEDIGLDDMESQWEKFTQRMKGMGWDNFTSAQKQQWEIQWLFEIGEVDKSQEAIQKFAESVDEVTRVADLSETGIQGFVDKLKEQQSIMNDTTQTNVAHRDALKQYNDIMKLINKQNDEDIQTILEKAGVITELKEAEEDLEAQETFMYNLVKNRYSDAISGLSKEYAAYKKVKFTGEDEELKNLHDLDLAIKKQTLAQLGLKDAVSKTNDELTKDEYSAWVETVNQFITSAIENGNLLGQNVSQSIKKYQTTLLSTSKFSEKASENEKTALEKLEDERTKAQLEYEIGIGEQRYQLGEYIKDIESEGEVTASSAKIAAQMIEKKYKALENLKSQQDNLVMKYEEEQRAIKAAELGLDYATISAVNNLGTQELSVDSLIKKYQDLAVAQNAPPSTTDTGGNDTGGSSETEKKKWKFEHKYRSGVSGRGYGSFTEASHKAKDMYGHHDWFNLSDFQFSQYAKGGLINKPTMALMGEAGPEMVVPLTGPNAGNGANMSINIETVSVSGISGDPNAFAYAFAKELRRELRTL